jgi:hypothetical protein
VNQREPALGRNQLDDLLEMVRCVGGGEHESRRADAQRCDLRGNRLAMVDDVMGAEILNPVGGSPSSSGLCAFEAHRWPSRPFP